MEFTGYEKRILNAIAMELYGCRYDGLLPEDQDVCYCEMEERER